MRVKRLKEEFRHPNHITFTLEKFSSFQDKRSEIIKSSGLLFYIFGFKLESKPWLTYQERYDIF